MKILLVIDPGHGKNTPGKSSPDNTLYEWQNNRELAHKVSLIAKSRGIEVKWTVNDNSDPSLTSRANKANTYFSEFKKNNPEGKTCFVSLHSDASGNGQEWRSANGFSVYTTKGQNNSDKLGSSVWNAVNEICPKKYGIKMRADNQDKDPDFEANFTVILKANAPAILIENLFHDNEHDVELLKNEEYMWTVAGCIVEGILRFLNK